MIVYELICREQHRFEGWFASAEDFDSQKNRGLLSCPVCSNSNVEKLPTAKIRTTESLPPREQSKALPIPAVKPRDLYELVDYVLQHTEDVGERFPEEARRIHRKEAPERGIRGVANRKETQELLEEGIAVLPLPIPPKSEWH